MARYRATFIGGPGAGDIENPTYWGIYYPTHNTMRNGIFKLEERPAILPEGAQADGPEVAALKDWLGLDVGPPRNFDYPEAAQIKSFGKISSTSMADYRQTNSIVIMDSRGFLYRVEGIRNAQGRLYDEDWDIIMKSYTEQVAAEDTSAASPVNQADPATSAAPKE